MFQFVLQDEVTDAFLRGIFSGAGVIIFGYIVSFCIQYYMQGRQFKNEKKNLERTLKQSEENIKLQILGGEQKKSIEELYGIIYHEPKLNYSEMKKRLDTFLESVKGHYLPKNIYDAIKSEINTADSFIHKTLVDAGMAPPDDYSYESYEDWYDNMSQEERADMDIETTQDRFIANLKSLLRTNMSK